MTWRYLTIENPNGDGEEYFRSVSDKSGEEGGNKVRKGVIFTNVLDVVVKPVNIEQR